MSTPRPKLFVAKCHCGCGMWAAFKTRRLTRDEHGRYREQGMYEVSWRQALGNAIRWTTQPQRTGAVMANLKVMAGAKITFAMPDGLLITWTSESDTDTSHLIDTIARFENAADVPVPAHNEQEQ